MWLWPRVNSVVSAKKFRKSWWLWAALEGGPRQSAYYPFRRLSRQTERREKERQAMILSLYWSLRGRHNNPG
eukprot:545149-Amphidinium_carterae.1